LSNQYRIRRKKLKGLIPFVHTIAAISTADAYGLMTFSLLAYLFIASSRGHFLSFNVTITLLIFFGRSSSPLLYFPFHANCF